MLLLVQKQMLVNRVRFGCLDVARVAFDTEARTEASPWDHGAHLEMRLVASSYVFTHPH